MNFEQLCKLINVVAEAGLEDFSYEEGNLRLRMKGKREHRPPCPPPVMSQSPMMFPPMGMMPPAGPQFSPEAMPAGAFPAAGGNVAAEQGTSVSNAGIPAGSGETVNTGAATAQAAEDGKIIKAPLVGIFYAAPAEGAAPFVKVGDSIKSGQVVAIVEAMKLMNEIEAESDGIIAEILVKNGEAVEYGQPLFRLR